MEKNDYIIVKTAEGSMTTYRVANVDTADEVAICHALSEAAKDIWQYVTIVPGTYTAVQLKGSKSAAAQIDTKGLPKEKRNIRIECGSFRCEIRDVNIDCPRLFYALYKYEVLAHVNQRDRQVFTARKDLGKQICEARVILPRNIKAICAFCGNDPIRPSLCYPAIDLDRRCIVATDGYKMVARKIAVTQIHYEEKVPETFYLPKEVARMRGEVTVRLFEKGCTVIDDNGIEVSVEHEARYPRWHSVWPTYRGGMAIIDNKAMPKAIKRVAGFLPGHGKDEGILLAHYPDSCHLLISGYKEAEIMGEQSVNECISPDDVAWRLPVKVDNILTALAMKPKTMWAGYSKDSALPSKLIMEDSSEQMAIIIQMVCGDALRDYLHASEQEFAVTDKALNHCFEPDGWLLEQVETKYPTCAKQSPEPKKTEERRQEEKPKLYVENPFVHKLREVLKVKLAA